MKKVGILGGTFDPIHLAHIELARTALREYNLAEVRFMTGGNPPHKREKQITDARLRHDMVKLALSGEKKLIADDYEVNKADYCYSAVTLGELRKLHPDWEIYFIIGEDSLYDLPKWYKPQEVCKNCILLVYPRGDGGDFAKLIEIRKSEFNADIRKITAPCIDVSSTLIRKRIREGEDIGGMVCDEVRAYIEEMGLYK